MKSVKVTHFCLPILWIGLFVVALGTRFYDLSNKPIHFDESINGWFSMQMDVWGFYKYDPQNYHGPLYFYLLHSFETLWGRSLHTLRAVPAVFSIFSVMIFTFGILQSRVFRWWMAFFVLTSPAFIFFGRSGIHEMPFVFFQMVLALGILRWFEAKDQKALALVLIGVWGLVTLKETFTITIFCMGLGLLSLGFSELKNFFNFEHLKVAWTRSLTFLSLVLALWFFQFYTGFFRNGAGVVDFVKSLLPWLKTGMDGKGHEKGFFYWLQVLWQAEPLVLLGVVLAAAGIFSGNKALRFISVFAMSQLLVYSLIPYKTVWCILTLIWGFYFVLAVYASRRGPVLWAVGLLLLFGFKGTYSSVFAHPIEMSHPYVYVNSTYELRDLQQYIVNATQKTPAILSESVQIGMQEQWPWPWLLRSFKSLDYRLCSKQLVANALLYFCDAGDALKLETVISEPYWKLRVTMRQSKEASLVYLKKSVFIEKPLLDSVETVGEVESQ